MTPTLALLLKAPRLGTVKTRLAAALGPETALAVYRTLVVRQLRALPPEFPLTLHYAPGDTDTANELRAWLAPLLSANCTLAPQPDGDLGTRLTAAFAHAFAAGAPAVLALGADCPGLDCAFLRRAAAALAAPDTDAVLGPATDGGYTLLSLRAPCPAAFHAITWSTPAVLAQTRAHLRTAGLRVSELPTLDDLDTLTDLHRAIATGFLPPLTNSQVAAQLDLPPFTHSR
jgi:rSAM/selenodomain-associated transferase 1